MKQSKLLFKCGIRNSRIITIKYIILILSGGIAMLMADLFTSFKYQIPIIFFGLLIVLTLIILLVILEKQTLSFYDTSYEIKTHLNTVTYSYSTILGVIKNISPTPVATRYKIITSKNHYFLDTAKKDIPEYIYSKIGLWVFDANFKPGLVCWKRITTDKIPDSQNYFPYIQPFLIALAPALSLLVFLLLRPALL